MQIRARAARPFVLLASSALLLAPGARAQTFPPAQPAPWVDPSPHGALLVAAEPDVQLEVLDWGGKGDALVFLAGLSNTAHSFDEFAPRFRDGFHVVGITRRGFGASSRPGGGYDPDSRARDILAVLDSLGVGRAILVGHSIAGDELSRFAVDYPERVRALVYLDAYSYGPDESGTLPPFPPQAIPAVTPADSESVESLGDYLLRRYGVRPPESELREVARFDATGRLTVYPLPDARLAVYRGTMRSDYTRIQAPALAIYATHPTAQSFVPGFAAFDGRNRGMAQAYFGAVRGWQEGQIRRFRSQMRHGTVVELSGANHFLHYSNPDEVERAMRAFLATLPR